ncbi:MAG: hypothetical protein P8Y38_14725 [Deltaproteobacteria bacterium]
MCWCALLTANHGLASQAVAASIGRNPPTLMLCRAAQWLALQLEPPPKKALEHKMKWMPEAEEAIKKVPFFVRKRVRARVEKEAIEAGKQTVSLADVKATRARYLTSMSSEIKGYQIETCFGPSGCPNRAIISDHLVNQIESEVKKEDLLGFLKQSVKGDLKFHHEFRITLADCPNACSQPQIKDIGIIGADV